MWHARRAREFQRMAPGDVVQESEQNLKHDIGDGALLERALKLDLILRQMDRATEKAEP